MEKVLLWKRAKEGGQSASAPWMEHDEPAAPSERDVAHSYVQHIGHEYARLRARLYKLERSKDENMTKADISADTNILAMDAFDRLAEQVRKDNPKLTAAQAFEKAYTDPKNTDLRRLERNSAYASIGAPLHYEQPIAKSIPVEESGSAYQSCMRKAEAAHKADPSKTIAMHFEKIYCCDESLRRQDISERNISKAGYPPVADTGRVEGATGSYAELCRKAEELRANNPAISFAKAFERVAVSNPELMQRERAERYARMGL